MDQRDIYRRKIRARLDEIEAEIARLEAKTRATGAEAEQVYAEQLTELRARYAAVEDRLAELRGAGEDAFDELRTGVETAWDDLATAMRRSST